VQNRSREQVGQRRIVVRDISIGIGVFLLFLFFIAVPDE
jgi:hypothetical protein